MAKKAKAKKKLENEVINPFTEEQSKVIGNVVGQAIHAATCLAYRGMSALMDEAAKGMASGQLNALQAFGMVSMKLHVLGDLEAKEAGLSLTEEKAGEQPKK